MADGMAGRLHKANTGVASTGHTSIGLQSNKTGK